MCVTEEDPVARESHDAAPTPPRRLRVMTLLDGSEEYGLARAIASLQEAHDPRSIQSRTVFLGSGPARDIIWGLADESCCLDTGPLIPLRRIGRPRLDLLYLAGRLRILMRSVQAVKTWLRRHPVDIIHTHSPAMSRVAAAATSGVDVRLLWHCHGPYNLRPATSRWFVGFARRRIDRIICISDFVRRTLPRTLQDSSVVVHNGVPVQRIIDAALPGAFRTTHAVRPDQPLIGLFGAIMPRKGHRYFLEAAASVITRVPDARFAIVGGTTEGHRKLGVLEELNEWITRLKLGDVVIRTGYLPDATRYMADFDVLTMPTVPIPTQIGEGFGLVMIEGMAQGVATIASDCGAPREVIQDGVNGLLVPPADSPALAQAMIKLLTDGALRRRLADTGRQTVRQRFDSHVMAARMLDIYADCLDRRLDVKEPP